MTKKSATECVRKAEPMSGYHYYVLIAGCFACYVLGRKHALVQGGWKNTAAALDAGAAWPAMVAWGAWLAHMKPGGDRS